MKKISILFLILLLVLTLSGCGAKEKMEKKVSEKIAEKVIEKASGGDVNVNLSGDQVTFKDKDGKEVSFGGSEWPKAVTTVPEFKKGEITGVMEDNEGSAMIVIEKVKKGDFESYLKDIKEGFTENTFDMTMDKIISYGGDNGKDISVQLTYDIESETLSIMTGKVSK